MDDMRLDPSRNEPARQPEPIAASLIGQRDLADRPASTHRLASPPLDQSQQCCRIRFQLLQRLALPEWMARPEAAALGVRSPPLVPLQHLRELRITLDSLLSSLSDDSSSGG